MTHDPVPVLGVDSGAFSAHNRAMFKASIVAALFAVMACDKGPSQRAEPVPTAAKATEAAAAAVPAATVAAATPAAANGTVTAEGTAFGAPLTQTETVAISALLADPKAYAGKTVRVEGMITDVCPKRGCWFEMAGEGPGQKLRFKVQDGDMVFPLEAKGSHAIAQGVVAVRDLSLEETKEYLEYQAKEYKLPVDPAQLEKPMQIVRLDGTGAVIHTQK